MVETSTQFVVETSTQRTPEDATTLGSSCEPIEPIVEPTKPIVEPIVLSSTDTPTTTTTAVVVVVVVDTELTTNLNPSPLSQSPTSVQSLSATPPSASTWAPSAHGRASSHSSRIYCCC